MIIAGSIVGYLLIGYLFAVFVNHWDDPNANSPVGLLIACNLVWPFFMFVVGAMIISDWYVNHDFRLSEKIHRIYRIK